MDCSGDDEVEKTPETAFLNKKSALLQLVEGSPVPKTIVFCNKVSRWTFYGMAIIYLVCVIFLCVVSNAHSLIIIKNK